MVSAMNLIANLPGVDVAYDYEIETAMQQLTMGLHDPTIEIGTGFLAAWFLAMKRRR
jgi:hypothetical protein